MSSKAPKQRASAQELLLAQQGVEKDARYEKTFRPLETSAINEIKTANLPAREALLKGRASADVSQRASGMEKELVASNASRGIAVGNPASVDSRVQMGVGVAEGTSVAMSDAQTAAKSSLDQDWLNVLRTGSNVNRAADTALVNSARLANSRAASKINAKRAVSFATGEALGNIVAAGVGGHIDAKDRAFATTPVQSNSATIKSSAYAVPDDQLSFYARNLRRRAQRE